MRKAINPNNKSFIATLIIALCLLIIFLLDSLYPITLTFDSGHYLMLADLVNKGEWNNWDPIRGAIFPTFLSLVTKFLNEEYAFIPLALFHVLDPPGYFFAI